MTVILFIKRAIMIEKVTSDIFIVGGENSAPSDAAVYLVKTDYSAVLIDAGTAMGSKSIFANIIKTGVDPETIGYIFLTHCHYDHTGGAAALREMTGAQTVAHELDAPYIENGDSLVTAASWYNASMEKTPVDIRVSGKQSEFSVEGRIFTFYHAPGHTPGSSVITVLSDEQLVLFGQDVHGPLHPDFKSNRKDYFETLRFMAALNADILCEGHYGVLKGSETVRAFIESFIR